MESGRTLFDEMRLERVLREGNKTPWTLCNLKTNSTAHWDEVLVI